MLTLGIKVDLLKVLIDGVVFVGLSGHGFLAEPLSNQLKQMKNIAKEQC